MQLGGLLTCCHSCVAGHSVDECRLHLHGSLQETQGRFPLPQEIGSKILSTLISIPKLSRARGDAGEHPNYIALPHFQDLPSTIMVFYGFLGCKIEMLKVL